MSSNQQQSLLTGDERGATDIEAELQAQTAESYDSIQPHSGGTKVPRNWDTVVRGTEEISFLPDDADEIVPKIRTISP